MSSEEAMTTTSLMPLIPEIQTSNTVNTFDFSRFPNVTTDISTLTAIIPNNQLQQNASQNTTPIDISQFLNSTQNQPPAIRPTSIKPSITSDAMKSTPKTASKRFTDAQVEKMTEAYNINPNLNKDDRTELAKEIGLSEEQ
ncbi:hypothetical protein HK096_002995, partial [Nowakowskiella sp. JEL0078]